MHARFGAGASEKDWQQYLAGVLCYKNLREALQRLLNRLHDQLAQLPETSGALPPARQRQRRTRAEKAASTSARLRHLARYERVVELSKQGGSSIGIARQLHMSRQTVRKFVQAKSFPERAPWFRTTSLLDPYRSYLELRWEQGCRNARVLWQELMERGFTGSYMMVNRWRQLQLDPTPAQQTHLSQADLSTRTKKRSLAAPYHLAWLLLGDPTQLEKQEQDTLSFLRQDPLVNKAYGLAQQLITMVKERTADALEEWLLLCTESEMAELENFAQGLRKEVSALQAALTLAYSNGPVEGHITRLKLIKRTMYGRGGFEILRQRVLKAA